MTDLTDEGRKIVSDLADRHGLSTDAVTHMLRAVANGHGTQAQFNHPELGGMGQWSQGGMTMVGDMFNHGLKARVDTLCSELSGFVRDHSLFAAPASSQSQSQGTGGQMTPQSSLFVQTATPWPAELGTPASVGAQNDMRYAYFPAARRLAVDVAGRITLYDTGDHQIGGFGQAQSGTQSLSFTSQYGQLRLSDLPVVGGGADAPAHDRPAPQSAAPAAPAPDTPPSATQSATPSATPSEPMTDDQIFSRIERLAGLFEKGILSQSEYETKKAELLARL